MENISSLKKLDTVLDYLRKTENLEQNESDALINRADVANYLYSKFDYKITHRELSRIFVKLTNDGYMDTIIGDCYLTHEGYWFHGYIKQKEIDDLNQAISIQKEKRTARNEIWLTYGTWFAGFAALLLLLWQVFLWYFPTHADYPYIWIWERIIHK